jgi:hypothetical protein
VSIARILLLIGAFLLVGAQTRTPEEQHAIAAMITQCTEDHRQFFASGLTRPQYLLFCNCYVFSATDMIDTDEVGYRREHGGSPSPKFIETSRALVGGCVQEARNRQPD